MQPVEISTQALRLSEWGGEDAAYLFTDAAGLAAFGSRNIGSYDTETFTEAATVYDDGFFGGHSLLVVVAVFGSGSIRAEVSEVRAGPAGVEAELTVQPLGEGMLGTADMAYRCWLVETPKLEPGLEVSLQTVSGDVDE